MQTGLARYLAAALGAAWCGTLAVAEPIAGVPTEQAAEAASPMERFGVLMPGAWLLDVANGSQQRDVWRWGPGGHSVIGRMTNSKGDGESTCGVLRVLYWHPGRKEIAVLAMSQYGLVADGTVTPSRSGFAFDQELYYDRGPFLSPQYPKGTPRPLSYVFAFDGPDRYRAEWTEDDGVRVPPGMVIWDYRRVDATEVFPAEVKPVEEIALPAGTGAFDGGVWEDGSRTTSIESIPHLDAVCVRVMEAGEDDQDSPVGVFESYIYRHAADGGIRYLGFSASGEVEEGVARDLGGGRLELEFTRHGGGVTSHGVRRLELDEDGSLLTRAWESLEAVGAPAKERRWRVAPQD